MKLRITKMFFVQEVKEETLQESNWNISQVRMHGRL